MNIVYLLTNLNKKEGEKRFYIGAKSECRLEMINNIPTIIDIKSEKPYIGSASSFEMKEDIKNNNLFSASILEIVKNRNKILEYENQHIIKNNAVCSEEFYNQSEAKLGGFNNDHNAIINLFGEKRKDYNSSKSGVSKKRKTAKKYGFKNIADFCIWIYKEKEKTPYFTDIAKKLSCERHIPARMVEKYDMQKCLKEINKIELKFKIRDLYVKGASYNKISEILNIEIPTVDYFMDDFLDERNYLAANRKNLTEEELQLKIVKLYLNDNKSIVEISKNLGINSYSAKRYFDKYVRKHLKINDL